MRSGHLLLDFLTNDSKTILACRIQKKVKEQMTKDKSRTLILSRMPMMQSAARLSDPKCLPFPRKRKIPRETMRFTKKEAATVLRGWQIVQEDAAACRKVFVALIPSKSNSTHFQISSNNGNLEN